MTKNRQARSSYEKAIELLFDKFELTSMQKEIILSYISQSMLELQYCSLWDHNEKFTSLLSKIGIPVEVIEKRKIIMNQYHSLLFSANYDLFAPNFIEN